MKNISRDVILGMPVALPPLAEQQRIVTKVESLIKLCDKLEAQLLRVEDRASRMAKAVVEEMVWPGGD
jgi:type I restriction enzyme S subunit